MKYSPLFTIITFVENEEQYLDDFFESILNQTYKKIEVIFIDNNSDDLSFEKAVGYSHILQQNGMSLQIEKNKKKYDFSNNVSLASKKIEGDYLVFLSAKDRIVSSYAEKVIEAFEKNPNAGAVIYSQNYLKEGQIYESKVIDKETTGEKLRERLIFSGDLGKAQIVRKNALGGIIAKYSVTVNHYKHIYDLFVTSCLADVALVDEVLVETEYIQELLPEEKNLLTVFEKYSMLLAFQTKSKVLLSTDESDKIKQGIKNLALECMEKSIYMKEKGETELSVKYARLAKVFDSGCVQ